MEINIPIEELQKRSLFIATPMYGGQCAGMYTKSVNDLASLCMHYKLMQSFIIYSMSHWSQEQETIVVMSF